MRNIQRFISLSLLYQIVQCEISPINLSNNFDETSNLWKTSPTSDSSTWNTQNNGKTYDNPGLYNYAADYQDRNVKYGYHVRNDNAEVWVNANIDHTPWNNNYNVTSYNNDWNQIQNSWNNKQSSSPQLYYYPKPETTTSAPVTTKAPTSTTTTTTAVPEDDSGYTYVPQTNYYLPNLNGVPNDLQSVLQQIPVIDLTKPPENKPKPAPRPSNPNSVPGIDLTKLPETVPATVPINFGPPKSNNVQPISNVPQINLEPVHQSQFFDYPNHLPLPYSQPSSHPQILPQNVPSLNSQPFQENNQPWFQLPSQQDPAINVNILKPEWTENFPPFNTNENGPGPSSINFPVLNAPPLLRAPFPVNQNEQKNSQPLQPDLNKQQNLLLSNPSFPQNQQQINGPTPEYNYQPQNPWLNLNLLPVSTDLNIGNSKIKRSYNNMNNKQQLFNGHAYPVMYDRRYVANDGQYKKENVIPNLYVSNNNEKL